MKRIDHTRHHASNSFALSAYFAHLWFILSIIPLALFAFTLVALWIGSESTSVSSRDLSPADKVGVTLYSRGLQQFSEGRLQDALANFEAARATDAPSIITAANHAWARTKRALALPSWLADLSLPISEQPVSIQLLIAGLCIVLALLLLARWLQRFPLRRGVDIGAILVVPADQSLDEARLRQYFRDRLEHIGFRYERPGGLGEAISPALVVGPLLPTAGDDTPLRRALGGLGELSAKGAAAFTLGQAERALSLLYRHSDYRVTVVLRLVSASGEAWGKLADVRSRRELLRVNASVSETALYTRPETRTSGDSTNNLAFQLLDVVAYKMWHALSAATRPGLRPASWVTLAQFVSGVDAMTDAQTPSTSARALARATADFSYIKEDDPTYFPARFFRGFTLLLRGELTACTVEFTDITERVQRAAWIYSRSLAEDLAQSRLPLIRVLMWLVVLRARLQRGGRLRNAISRFFDVFEEAFEWWREIFHLTRGGTLYNIAETWKRHKDSSLPANTESARAALQIRRDMFGLKPDLQEVFDRVLALGENGLQSSDAKFLDELLDSTELRKFDHQTQLLDIKLHGAQTTRQIRNLLRDQMIESTSAATDKFNENFFALKSGILGLRYEPALNAMEAAIKEQDFGEARKVLRRIRQDVQFPDLLAAGSSIRYEVTSLSRLGRSAILGRIFPFMPTVLKAHQMIIEDQFYLESRYYLLLAKYQSLDVVQLKDVVDAEMDSILHNYFLNVPLKVSDRNYELVSLLRCLISSAQARLALMDPWQRDGVIGTNSIGPVIIPEAYQDRELEIVEISDRAQTSIAVHVLTGSRLTDIRWWRNEGSIHMKASASALLAQLARLQAKDETRGDLQATETDPRQLLEEALSHEPTAMRHIELAEFLAAQGEFEEAKRMLHVAQKIAPSHPVARHWLR